MTALERLTTWLFEGGEAPDPNDFEVLAEAVRLLDELPAEEDRLAALIEGALPGAPVAALWAVAGPRGRALLVPWLGEGVADEVRVLVWLLEGGERPDVAPAVGWAVRAGLRRLGAGFFGDEGARLRFGGEVLDRLDGWLEVGEHVGVDEHAGDHDDEHAHVHDPVHDHDPVPVAAPVRWGRWGVGLALAAALTLFWMQFAGLRPLPLPTATVGVGPSALVTAPPPVAPPTWPEVERPPAELGETPDRPALIPVPAGTFMMGSPPTEVGRAADEPRHQVTLTRGFYLARTELTQGQWRALMGRNPSKFQGNPGDDARPAENMTWFEALEALNALSAREGLPACYTLSGCSGGTCARADFAGLDCPGYRLPTEAEWEYAARAGSLGATWVGELDLRDVRHAPVLDAIAWYSGNSGVARGGLQCPEPEKMQRPAAQCGTHPVATKAANPLGFYDMIGNVWEWTQDGYGPLSEAAVVDPQGTPGSDRRVTKGCDWFRDARFCRAANRYRPRPDYRSSVIGLRPARTIAP